MKREWAQTKQTGFTIVELLIVVVVIAILAAITIVAYNGISERAKDSAMQSTVSQNARKVLLYAATNSDQLPTSIEDAGIATDANLTYTYVFNNDTNPRVYCLSAHSTDNPANAYAITSSSTDPIEGICVRNLALDPSAEGSTSNFRNIGNNSATTTNSIDGSMSHSGDTSYRRDITGEGQVPGVARMPTTHVLPDEPLSWSYWAYSTRSGTMALYAEGRRIPDDTYTGMGAGGAALPQGEWVKFSGTGNSSVNKNMTHAGGYNLLVQPGDTVWFDDFMIVKGEHQYEFRDGDSPGWVWEGTAHNSSSFGPSVRINE